jgi:hypothetical protein
MDLFGAEFKKLMSKSFGLLLVLLMLILKLTYLVIEDSRTNTYILENKAAYLSIVNRYTGRVTQDVSDQIEAENALVLRADSELRRLRLDYNDELITTEEFERDLPQAEKLANNKELFLYFYSQYLSARGEPDTRYILFSEGWDRFFSTVRLDWFSSLVVIIFAALLFGKEYETDMQRLQISTSKGDTKLVVTKLLVLFSVIFVVSLLSFLSEFLYFNLRYGLPNWDFPYQSIAIFRNSSLHLTIAQATLLTFMIRLFGFCILGIITISISIASQSVIPALIGGLTLVVLPFVLPVSNSSKVFLPSPYSLIISTPFLYASNDPLLERNIFSIISRLTHHHIGGILAFWVVVIVFLICYIKRKFGYVRYTPHKNKSSLLICLLLIPLLLGCTTPGLKDIDELTVNFSNDLLYSYSDPYIVSLFPTFMLEDTSNASLAQINRDPFLDKEFVDKHVGGIFIAKDVLYYSIMTNDYDQIRSVNLSNWDIHELYTRYPQQQVSIINDNLEIHSASQGKSLLPFMIYDNKIFILSNEELVMVNLGSSKAVPIINKISQQGGLAFKDGIFYYINKINELRMYSLVDKADKPIFGIKAMYQLFIRGNHLYFQDLNRGLTLYSLDLDSNEIRQVLNADIGYYVCDDTNVYFSNLNDNGFLYRSDLISGEQTLIAPIAYVSNIQVFEGKPYLYIRAVDPEVGNSLITYKIHKTDWHSERLEYYEGFNNAMH